MRSAANGLSHGRTRERVTRLLARKPLTASALAKELGVTVNAVRAQLALLQREGLVEVQGEAKGARRPAARYGLRAGAEAAISSAYPGALSSLVRVLSRRLSASEMELVMRDLGAEMASREPRPQGTPRERLRAALAVLGRMGSVAEVSESGGTVRVSGDLCPIADAVAADTRSCQAIVAMLETLTGLTVMQRCAHEGRPRCRFDVVLPAEA
jgi:predicted ArsR family transcriptional regulator